MKPARIISLIVLTLSAPVLLWLALIVLILLVHNTYSLISQSPLLLLLSSLFLLILYLAIKGKLVTSYKASLASIDGFYSRLIDDWHEQEGYTRIAASFAVGVIAFITIMPTSGTMMVIAFHSIVGMLLYLLHVAMSLTIGSPRGYILSLDKIVEYHFEVFFWPSLIGGIVFSSYTLYRHIKMRLPWDKVTNIQQQNPHFELVIIGVALIIAGNSMGGFGVYALILAFGLSLIPGGIIAGKFSYWLMNKILRDIQ